MNQKRASTAKQTPTLPSEQLQSVQQQFRRVPAVSSERVLPDQTSYTNRIEPHRSLCCTTPGMCSVVPLVTSASMKSLLLLLAVYFVYNFVYDIYGVLEVRRTLTAVQPVRVHGRLISFAVVSNVSEGVVILFYTNVLLL